VESVSELFGLLVLPKVLLCVTQGCLGRWVVTVGSYSAKTYPKNIALKKA